MYCELFLLTVNNSFDHPTEQRVSSFFLLNRWYYQVFEKGYEEGIIFQASNIVDDYLPNHHDNK